MWSRCFQKCPERSGRLLKIPREVAMIFNMGSLLDGVLFSLSMLLKTDMITRLVTQIILFTNSSQYKLLTFLGYFKNWKFHVTFDESIESNSKTCDNYCSNIVNKMQCFSFQRGFFCFSKYGVFGICGRKKKRGERKWESYYKENVVSFFP